MDTLKLRDSFPGFEEWGRLDTLQVIAGVSSLRPIHEIAGLERVDNEPLPDASSAGIREGVRIASAALQGNFYGPLVAALTFVSIDNSSPR